MKPFSLPAGWEIKLFGQCIKKVKYTEKQPTKSFLPEGKFPIVSQEKELISGYSNNQNAVFSVKNPVVIFGDHTKVVKYIDFDFVIGADGAKILQPIEDINAKYFYYYLSHLHLRDLGYARHYKLLKECIVIYPPLPEQKRIVEKLDKIFAAIDKAKSQTEKNLQNAKDVFNSCLNNIFNHPAHNWEEKTLGEVSTIKGGKRVPKGYKLVTYNTGHPYIRVADFSDKGTIDCSDIHFIEENVYKRINRYIISSKDIYISIAGTIGKSGIIPIELDGANLTENACKLVLNTSVFQKFLYYFTLSNFFLSQIVEQTKVAGQPKLALSRLANIKLYMPSYPEQEQIAKVLDILQSKTQELEKIYTQKLADLEELKQSVLQQAFSGKL